MGKIPTNSLGKSSELKLHCFCLYNAYSMPKDIYSVGWTTSMRFKVYVFKKATKFDEIFTVDLTLCSKCQIDGEDFVNFCGLLRKHEL